MNWTNLLARSGMIGAFLLSAVSAFGQGEPKSVPPKPDKQPQQSAPGGSSVVIRQSGGGNRAVVRQSADGITTDVVQAEGGTNTVDVRHDGRSTVTIVQGAPKAAPRPDSTKRNE